MTGRLQMTLSQLQAKIKETLCGAFVAPVWVVAEISELKVNSRSGHCYIQLVEKGGRNGVPQAQASAVIWAGQFGMLTSYFRGATGAELMAGMNVMLSVVVTYHELYGLSLRVVDIDPLYTLGDLEQQRLQTIARLKEDGVFELNRELGIPDIPQRIAIVSSPTAAGYQDFMKELTAYTYRFETQLFEAVMQGHGAEQSIADAMGRIADSMDDFDVVVIIRGGGSQSDLSFLNSYLLSSHVAQFPLPVIAGLGHDKDQSVVDLVAALSLKTPTAVAAYLIDRLASFDNDLEMLGNEIAGSAQRMLLHGSKELHMLGTLLRERVSGAVSRLEWKIVSLSEGLKGGAKRIFYGYGSKLEHAESLLRERPLKAITGEVARLSQTEKLLTAVDPQTVLSRGFAIVRVGGKVLKDASLTEEGAELDVTLYKGKLTAKVTDYEKE